MNILYLTASDPRDRTYGGALRSHHIHGALEATGEVDTLIICGSWPTSIDSAWDDARIRTLAFGASERWVISLRNRWLVRHTVRQVMREKKYDAIVARCVGLAVFVPPVGWARLVLDADDLQKTPAPSAGVRLRLRLALRNLSVRALTLFPRHVWYVRPRDATSSFRRNECSLLSNATELPNPARGRPPVSPNRLVMVGLWRYAPNADGLRWFAETILPRLILALPDVELHAIGQLPDMPMMLGDSVRMRGFVADLAAEYDSAACVVAPIFSGAGTQIKVIDALAHGRPLVTSAFAHGGFESDLKTGVHLLVAKDEAAWVEACLWALTHSVEAAAMGARGEAVVKSTYGTEAMTEQVRATLLQMNAETSTA